MEKQIRKFEVNYRLNWLDGVEISKIKADIEELEKLGATHVEIDIASYENGYASEIIATSKRLETDEECQLRIKEEEERMERVKQLELKNLERLKAKYEL